MRSYANITEPTAKAISFTSICQRAHTRRKSSFESLQQPAFGQIDLTRSLQIDNSILLHLAPALARSHWGFSRPPQSQSCFCCLPVTAHGGGGLRLSPLSDKASIAVLPFENIGNDPKWDRFAYGMTEDIVTDLSHSKDLFVVARNSTEVYRGKPADVRSVGRDLGVRYVLEGSIQPSGDQIRVTAQLIDARTGGHLWSDRYDRPATDLFKVQSDVTQKIAGTLTGYEGAVAEAERSLIRRKPPSDLTAYETYLLGMEAKHKVTKEGLDEGERLFRKALEIDPQLARAYVGLAYIYDYRTRPRSRNVRC